MDTSAEQNDLSLAYLALARAAVVDLIGETDEQRALRKALLLLVFMLQEQTDPGVTCFIDYLLAGFSPLTRWFEQNHHPFVGDEHVFRATLPDGHQALLIRRDYLHEAMRRYAAHDLVP